MNISSNMPQYQASWFNICKESSKTKCGAMTIKSEYLKDFEACCKERARIFKEAEASLPKRPMQVKLTDEQKKYLAETYERTDMTEEEYHAFAKDLHEFGILDDQDLADLGVTPGDGSADFFGACMLVGSGSAGVPTAKYSPLSPNMNYDEAGYKFYGGNMLDWVRYHASFRLCDLETQTFTYDRYDHMFNRLCSVLEQM